MGEVAIAFDTTGILIALVVSGLMQYFLFLSYYKALAELPAWIVKVILLIIPIITLVETFFIYDTVPTTLAIVGCVVVLISAFGIIHEQQVKSKLAAGGK